MIRPALAAAFLAATLFAAIVPTPSLLVLTDATGPAALAPDADRCGDGGDGREWSPRPEAAASMGDSAWKWRGLHAALAAGTDSRTIVTTRFTAPPRPRAPVAPGHLLHTPLLI